MNDPAESDILEAIIRQVLAKVERAYLEAVDLDVEEPTILVLDLRDEHALAIAELLLGPDLPRSFLAEGHRLGKRPDLAMPLPRSHAAAVVATRYPEIGANLAATNANQGYLAVVIAFGGGQIFEIRPAASIAGNVTSPSQP